MEHIFKREKKKKHQNDYHLLETILNYVRNFAKALQRQSPSSRIAANSAEEAKE